MGSGLRKQGGLIIVTTEATAVALRVLTAINNRQHPQESDVVLLQKHCPEHWDLPPDELACMVIQNAIKHKVQGIMERAQSSGTDT